MWIERPDKKSNFISILLNLDKQVLLVKGARQVGKTSFVLNALEGLKGHPQLKLNLLYPSSFRVDDVDYLGRDFFGRSETGEEFLKNIESELGENSSKPALIFVDEADRYPPALESIQTLAGFSDRFKFIFTGSNLENIALKNAATGRKKTFDLYPIAFFEFLQAGGHEKLVTYLKYISLTGTGHSDFFHNQLNDLLNIYIRIGGMPRIIDAYLSKDRETIPEIMKDLVFSIEENVKTVLGEKSKLYEYEDVLRKMAFLSMNTLKFSRLQVQHAGRAEVKKLVSKTVGARVAHKVRLFESESDLSKYILFDTGVENYLLNGSDLLKCNISSKNMSLLLETFVGVELIAKMVTRDDLFYWKSGNRAEVEFLLRSPFVGIDVKTKTGDNKSLNSLAIFEPDLACLVKVGNLPVRADGGYSASLPNYSKSRRIPLITLPHYLIGRLFELVDQTKHLGNKST